MTTIKLSHEDADDLICLPHNFALPIQHERPSELVLLLQPVQTDTILIEQKRWADILRLIFLDTQEGGGYWALDYEHSHTETAEPWSYIEPELKKVTAVETVVTVYELDTAGS